MQFPSSLAIHADATGKIESSKPRVDSNIGETTNDKVKPLRFSKTSERGDNEANLAKWAAGFILAGILLRILFIFLATNNGGDALSRAAITAKWLQHPNLSLDFADPNWPPVHFWLMAGLSLLVRNVELGCRLLSLLFGAFSVWVIWRLAREIYGEGAALLSLVLFAFYSLQIAYSTTSSSEATYLGLLLAAMLCFFLYRHTDNLRWLAVAGLLLSIDAGIRYEAWVFIFMMSLLLVFISGKNKFASVRHVQSLLVFGLTAGLWPVFWMIHEWRTYGNPLFALSNNYASIPEQLAVNPAHAGLYQVILVPGVILLTLTPLVFLGGFYALLLAIREARTREIALLAVGFGLFQFRTIATGGSLAMARYTLTDGILLTLLAGYGLLRLLQKWPVCSYAHCVWLTTAIIAINLLVIIGCSAKKNRFTDKFRSVSPLLQYPTRIDDIGHFLRPRLNASDAVVIDDYNTDSNIVASAIGLPLLSGDRGFLASRDNPAEVWNYIDSRHPQYLILANKGILKPYFALPLGFSGQVQFRGVEFKLLYQGEVYQVYKLSYIHPAA